MRITQYSDPQSTLRTELFALQLLHDVTVKLRRLFAKDEGIQYPDIKLSNILVEEPDRDGNAAIRIADLDCESSTPAFAAPSMFMQEKLELTWSDRVWDMDQAEYFSNMTYSTALAGLDLVFRFNPSLLNPKVDIRSGSEDAIIQERIVIGAFHAETLQPIFDSPDFGQWRSQHLSGWFKDKLSALLGPMLHLKWGFRKTIDLPEIRHLLDEYSAFIASRPSLP